MGNLDYDFHHLVIRSPVAAISRLTEMFLETGVSAISYGPVNTYIDCQYAMNSCQALGSTCDDDDIAAAQQGAMRWCDYPGP
jgi:hypothetical protein